MKIRSRGTIYPGVVAILFGIASYGATGQPVSGAIQSPGESQKQAVRLSPDARFMQEMIHHHAQALDMTALVPDRSSSHDVGLLTKRLEISQQDEIAWMRNWLERSGEEVPDTEGHERHDDQAPNSGDREHVHDTTTARPLMPGMLTVEEMAQLASATGTEFDQLFLQFMIHHHEGALTMVAELFSIDGAAQEPEVFRFASEIDSDQRAEIRRMRAMLDALPEPKSSR